MSGFTLQGALTALVTPFVADGSTVAWTDYERHVEAQISAGIDGLVPCGTTGESPTLSEAEQKELVERTVRLATGRVPVLAGVGSNNTKKAVELARNAIAAGANAAMLVMPYYNKPSQEGLALHISSVAKAIDAPLVLYNIPSRTAVDLAVETLLRLLDDHPNLVGIKDASGNCCYCQDLLCRASDRVFVLSGDDPLTLPLLAAGARGVISVTSNLYPTEVGAVVQALGRDRMAEARALHFALWPVHRALFAEPSPAPVKAALAMRGRMRDRVRPPLCEATEACRQQLSRILAEYEAQ
ncbi:4-hydroxy-tetrahydrodipicolinate synthase [Myxococcota bacterium]